MSDACTFCGIVEDGPDNDTFVWANDHATAFLDTRPLFPGHLLVVPNEHLRTLDDLPRDELEPFFTVVQAAMRAVTSEMDAEGTFVAANNVVSQSVPHLHVHVVPRTQGDGLRGFFWPRNDYDDEDHRADVRDRLADAMERETGS